MYQPFLIDQLRDTFVRMLICDDTRVDVLLDGELALRVEYEAQADRLACSIPLDRRKGQAEESALRELLSSNPWIGCAGVALSMSSDSGVTLVLYSGGITGLNDPRFDRFTDDLLAMVARWQEDIAASGPRGSSPTHGRASGPNPAPAFSARQLRG